VRFPQFVTVTWMGLACAVAAGYAQTPMAPAPLTPAQERGLKRGDVFRECEKCPEMVVVPAGRFTMGSPRGEKNRKSDEGPRHVVTIGRPFAVGKFHVTVDQFAVFAQETGFSAHRWCDWRSPPFFAQENSLPHPAQEGSHPVVCVNWDDVKAYVDWIAKKTGKPYRLLSEAEWEYAARGRTSPGTYPRFWFGDDERDLCGYVNFWDQTLGNAEAPCNDGYEGTSPAGHFAPNAFGLYDMAGNAWQLTADCYHYNYNHGGYSGYNGAPTDGSAWPIRTCFSRVIRGGGFGSDPMQLRAANRNAGGDAHYLIGFRLARTLAP
jgi:formylglycine-generating enzyme required for sulfatase activity